jgi:hypothetical protein
MNQAPLDSAPGVVPARSGRGHSEGGLCQIAARARQRPPSRSEGAAYPRGGVRAADLDGWHAEGEKEGGGQAEK